MKRRDFITLLGGAAAVWPIAARAQRGDRVRRIAVFIGGDDNDPVRKTYVSAFAQALAGLGWTDGRNVRTDVRWYGDGSKARAAASPRADLIAWTAFLLVLVGLSRTASGDP